MGSVYLVLHRKQGLVMGLGDVKKKLPEGIIGDKEWPDDVFTDEKVREFYDTYFNGKLEGLKSVDRVSRGGIILRHRIFIDD